MIGILSDVHGNVYAFYEALRLLRRQGATRFIYLGDALGYFFSPQMLDIVRSECGPNGIVLGGNHEAMIANGSTPPELEPIYLHSKIRQLMPSSELEFMRRLPSRVECSLSSGRVMYVHGSPTDPLEGYIFEDSYPENPGEGITHVICGHTHRPFIRINGGVTWVNVGSCGLPRDDGVIGSVALLDPVSGKARVLRFDIEEATRRTISEYGAPHASVLRVLGRRSSAARKDCSR